MTPEEKEVSRARTFNALSYGIPASYICRALNKHVGRGIQWRGMMKGELALIYAGTHSDFGSGLGKWTAADLDSMLATARDYQQSARKRP